MSVKFVSNKNGYIIFHDINSQSCPGIMQIWKEIKHDKCGEFIYSNTCGIGVYKRV